MVTGCLTDGQRLQRQEGSWMRLLSKERFPSPLHPASASPHWGCAYTVCMPAAALRSCLIGRSGASAPCPAMSYVARSCNRLQRAVKEQSRRFGGTEICSPLAGKLWRRANRTLSSHRVVVRVWWKVGDRVTGQRLPHFSSHVHTDHVPCDLPSPCNADLAEIDRCGVPGS